MQTGVFPLTHTLGPWQIDPVANELRDAEKAIRIEPKAMEVLMVLAKSPGQVVTREQLLDEVWPNVVVGDAALTQVVIKLRKALGDTVQSPKFIETIPKRGYRLLMTPEEWVDPAHETMESASPAASPSEQPAAVLRSRRWVVWMLLPTLFVAGFYVLRFQTPDGISTLEPIGISENAMELVGEERLAHLAETLPTISIQPLEIANKDPHVATLAKGLGWEIAGRLGHVSGLRVIASDGREAAVERQLGSRYQVSGLVQSEGGSIQISIRLVDRQSGRLLWSEYFQRSSKNILGVQEDIAQKLAAKLPIEVSEAERSRVAAQYTRSPEAYDAFLQGQAAFLVRTATDNARAREMFLKAIELDPQFARAYADIALTHIEDFRLWREQGREESLAEARRMAETAYHIDRGIREVHWVLSYIAMHERRPKEAITELRKALAIDPSYADAYALLALIHIYGGESTKAVLMMRTAMHLNPGAGHIYFTHLGTAYYFSGNQEQALINLNEARARNPADLQTRIWLAVALLAAGRKEEAQWEAEEVRAMRPGFSGQEWLERMPMQDAGQRQRLASALHELAL